VSLNQLRIQNIQSHKDTTLELSPGVNAILGVTDSGKSGILRGVRWWLFNTGTGLHSHWGGEHRVTGEFDDGTRVARLQFKGKNGYRLRLSDEELEFKKVRSDVPAEIQKALSIGTINWQNQHDPTFLFSESPPAVARRLNRLANLEVIDKAYRFFNSAKTRASRELAVEESRLKELQAEEAGYTYLGEAEALLDTAERAARKLGKANRKLASLDKCVSVLREWTRVRAKKDTLEEAHEKLQELEAAQQVLKYVSAEQRRVLLVGQTLATQLRTLKNARAQTERHETEYSRLVPERCPLCEQPWPKEK